MSSPIVSHIVSIALAGLVATRIAGCGSSPMSQEAAEGHYAEAPATSSARTERRAVAPSIPVADTPATKEANRPVPKLLAPRAKAALDALARNDCKALSKLVHPRRGVRLTPYASDDPKTGPVIAASDLCARLGDTKRIDWGMLAESDEHVWLTMHDYFARYVNDRDYRHAPEVSFDRAIERVTWNPEMMREAFPGDVFVDYHYPPPSSAHDLDWTSLFLVFEEEKSAYWLVGVIHHSWTP